jgi:MHS family shikimate/dehydroshikimate transporter-like MFS transporter
MSEHTLELPPGISRRDLKRVTAASVIGNTIEFYDFSIYGTLTALVFGRLFFPSVDPVIGTLLAFAAFGVGFISRPLGGIIFGHFGDRFGRKPSLVVSLLVMGGATAIMGLLPTYEQIGIVAPILLVILRFVQGFGIGGEWGGAVSLMVESAPRSRRGLYGAAVQTGSGFGIVLSTATLTILLSSLSTEQLLAWGWRIPLLVSAILVVVGLVIRVMIPESPQFDKVVEQKAIVKVPVWNVIRFHYRTVLTAIGLYIGIGAFGFIQGVFFISYITGTLHISSATATEINLVAAACYLVTTVLGGWLSDRFGRRRMFFIGVFLMIPATFIMFGSAATGSVPLLFLGMAIVGACSGIPYGVQASLFYELFPAKVRYTGISLGFQIAVVLGGGLSPIIAQLLVGASGGSTVPVSLYIVVLAVLAMFCTLIVTRVTKTEGGADSPALSAVGSRNDG